MSEPVGSGPRLGFVPELDGLRGIAVLLVVATHTRLLDAALYEHVLPKGGFFGVDIFFVLSGFLITALLLQERGNRGRVNFGAFYRRRALRLLPALLLLVAVHLVYARVDHIPAALERSSIVSVLFYFANWKVVYAHSFPVIAPGLAHVWSLSVEEQFYIVWPLVVVALFGRVRRVATVATVIVVAIAAVVVWRSILVEHHPNGIVYFRTDARADSLLVGALAAYLWFRRRLPSRSAIMTAAWPALVFVAICAARVDTSAKWLFHGGFTAVAIATAVMIMAIVETPWAAKRVLAYGPLRAIGRVSYGLYLWHYFVFYMFFQHTGTWSPWARIPVAYATTAVAVLASWFLVERPALRWKQRLDRGLSAVPG